MSDNFAAAFVLGKIVDHLSENYTPRDGDYLGKDGLFCCGKCHAPVQCRVELWGEKKIVPCLCKCQQEEMAAQKRQREEMERQDRIRRLKAAGIQEKHLLDWNFGVASDTEIIRRAKSYVNSWEKVKAQNLGLLFWGEVGTGKSFAAACIANALLEAGTPVLMTNFSKILSQMGAMYSDERYQYIASFSTFQLLIIDDLGIERNTEYALERVYAVIDERYKSGLPLIITTNLTIHELRNPPDAAHARIYSRVLEMCSPVYVGGGDRRTAVGRNKQSTAKEVLGL